MPEQWVKVQPGGPAGPFWGIVQSPQGYVIALQLASEQVADAILRDHARAAMLDEALALLNESMLWVEHFMPETCGKCGGPDSVCDMDCVDAAVGSDLLHRARSVLARLAAIEAE